MYSESIILKLIDLIYSAAGDAENWPVLLERLALTLGGTIGTIHHQTADLAESNFSSSWNVDPAYINEYTSHYGRVNLWISHRKELVQQGRVNTAQMLVPDEIMLRSEYYNDYLRRMSVYQMVAATVLKTGAVSSNLTIFRSTDAEPFGDADCDLLRTLMPHLQRAFQLHNRIEGLEKKANTVEATLDRLPTAVVLLDSRGSVLFMNKCAAALFQEQKYLRLNSTGSIRAVRPSEDKQLTCLIQGAVATGNGISYHSGGAMNISRNSYQRPLHVVVSPLRSQALYLGKTIPTAAVFITDPERKPWLPEEWLRQLYDLTPAESRLAQLLASGSDLKEAAEQLQVSRSTVRSQLKSIFAKTDSNRQSELIRLLLTGPAQLFVVHKPQGPAQNRTR